MESSPPNVGGVDAADVGMLPKPEEATEAEEEGRRMGLSALLGA